MSMEIEGRPEKNLVDCVEEDMKSCGLSHVDAQIRMIENKNKGTTN